MEDLRIKLELVEKYFQKYGATPINEKADKAATEFGLRRSFERNRLFYRVEAATFEEGDVIIISATENPRFAETGLEDNIAAFSSDYPEEKIEKEVRFAFGIDPYPETYPLYD
ncbi:MAG: hypothetical protein IIZ41_01220 [Lachnospiraceae bacterium]|jgi:hypothetical protein|nr:hypothetical protein [Lachnospiraceae bacterium]MBQ6637598.1 hypothetical protein [Lachnospiraceae bacterium]MBR3638294.1 hypothetical protein [Lachnospiraceae bacterium]